MGKPWGVRAGDADSEGPVAGIDDSARRLKHGRFVEKPGSYATAGTCIVVPEIGILDGVLTRFPTGRGGFMGATDGVLVDLHDEDEPQALLVEDKRLWVNERLSVLMFGSNEVLKGASASPPIIELPGLYFLVFRGKVVYVGQASSLSARVTQHLEEGRPVDSVAFIVGIPTWAVTEIEHAYIRAWSPPWNVETKRSGCLHAMPELMEAAETLDRSQVAEWFAPLVTPGQARWKAWQLHVLGWQQANG